MKKQLWLVVAVAVALSRSASASAEDSPDTAEQLATLTKEAHASYQLGHYEDALRSYEAAYKLKQVPTLLFNIAQCHRQLKQWEQAATTYRSFIRAAPDSPQVALANDLIKQVEEAARVAKTTQTAPPRDAGGHDVGPAILAQKPPPAPPENQRLASYVTGGAAVVALGAGTVLGLSAHSTSNDLANNQHTRAEVDSLQSSLHSKATAADVLLVAGGVLAVTAGVLFALHY